MKRLLQIALALCALVVLLLIAGAATFYALVIRELPEINTLADYRPPIITRIYAEDGTEIGRYSIERRIVFPIEDVPDHVKKAFVAAEDAAFYEHKGLDYPGIMRALIKNVQAGRVSQGGSTITQQVAKTFLLSAERSYIRKLKDMVLARQIEDKFDKEEILFLYLNQIYLGSGAYGIEAAAHTYYGKSTDQLSIAEGALIAGIVPRPSDWTPLHNPEAAIGRQREILRRMQDNGFISEAQRLEAEAEPLVLASHSWSEREAASAYFVEEVRRYLVDRFGEERVVNDGLQVHTTLHLPRQIRAYRAIRNGLRAHDRRHGYRGPLRNVDPEHWEDEIERLGTVNQQARPAASWVHEALVIEVDDEAEQARLAVGPGKHTSLSLEQLSWARKPNRRVDGAWYKLDRVSRALRTGDVVQLEVVGHRPVPEADANAGGDADAPDAEADPEGSAPEPIYELYQEPEAESALVAIDLDQGELDALMGGYSFARSQFNRALQMRRQPGSAFKPIVYAAALRSGYTPATVVYDTPVTYVSDDTGYQWKPENYSQQFYGPITVRTALQKSRNIAAVKVMSDVGVEKVIETSRRLGIESPLEENLGLALGNSDVTLTELVRAYTTFASHGRLIDPVFIREIRDRQGNLLEEQVTLMASQLTTPDIAQGPAAADVEETQQLSGGALEALMDRLRVDAEEREDDETNGNGVPRIPDGYALDPATAFLMTDLLAAVVEDGTGRRVRELQRPVAGKTGTTNDLFDAWFVGFTPGVAAGVWVGYDQPRYLGLHETGSRAASPIFLEYMQGALGDEPIRSFEPPPGIAFVQIDQQSGLLPCGGQTLFQPFREGTAPEKSCELVATQDGPARPLRLD